jgi:hypothetical protein
MAEPSYILFHKSLEQARRLGARGGRAHACNQRARGAPGCPRPSLPSRSFRRPGKPPPKLSPSWTHNFLGSAVPKIEAPGASHPAPLTAARTAEKRKTFV